MEFHRKGIDMDSSDRKPARPSKPRDVGVRRVLRNPRPAQTVIAIGLVIFFIIAFILIFLVRVY